jgi:spore maturation protein CgeB
MKIVILGLSITSSWGNGHATTYRALLRAFARRGHEAVFYEWDAPWYGGAHRDLPDPDFCRLILYQSWDDVVATAIADARSADAVLVGSYVHEGPRVIDALADQASIPLFFYDIDTPVTVQQLRRNEAVSLRRDQVPVFARYLSFTGGPLPRDVIEAELGAREARPLYCAVDTDRYRPSDGPVRADTATDLAYMGTYSPDREAGLESLLLEPARRLPDARFAVAGPQYPDTASWPANVRHTEHVPPPEHPAFYAGSAWQLNLTRAEMRRAGWSPSVRLFEAAACGAAILSDAWPGLEDFFKPGTEILLPSGPDATVEILRSTPAEQRRAIGSAARQRVLRDHSATRRAQELEALLTPSTEPVRQHSS